MTRQEAAFRSVSAAADTRADPGSSARRDPSPAGAVGARTQPGGHGVPQTSPTKPMRINFVFAKASMAGGVKSGRLLAEAAARRGHDVRILVPDPDRNPTPWWRAAIGRRRKGHKPAGGVQRHHLERSSVEIVKVRHARVLERHAPDADFTIANFWLAREWISGWGEGKGVQGLMVRGHFPQFGHADRIEAAYRRGGVLLAIGTGLRKLLLEGGARSVGLVPNGVDWQQFGADPRPRNALPRVGFLYGGSDSRKGADVMLEAHRLLTEAGVRHRLVAFGSRPLAHALPPDAEFRFRPPQGEIASIYRSCDCWVVPSRAEGFAMPGIEAAACRCPVVATLCGGPEDYIDDGGSGFLVPVEDPPAMADAIARVLTCSADAWSAMSERSYANARRFDWDVSAELLERHLAGVLDGSVEVNPCRL